MHFLERTTPGGDEAARGSEDDGGLKTASPQSRKRQERGADSTLLSEVKRSILKTHASLKRQTKRFKSQHFLKRSNTCNQNLILLSEVKLNVVKTQCFFQRSNEASSKLNASLKRQTKRL